MKTVSDYTFPVGVASVSSTDVADAAEKLTGKRSHMTGAIRLIEGGALAGPAQTLHLVRDDGVSSMDLGLSVVRAIESAPTSTVLVVTVEDGGDFAAFGAILGQLMKVRGFAGLVVDGSVRDRLDLRRIQLPTFARGAVAGSAGGHYRLVAVNEPLICGGARVCPGDLVVGDEDGVAIAPKAQQVEIMAYASRIQAKEFELLKRIEATGSYLKLEFADSDNGK